jgi:transcriptional antiterminator
MENYEILRVINNNVILVKEQSKQMELVLIGKGLGFSKRPGTNAFLEKKQIEKCFLAYDNKNKNEYLSLIDQLDDNIIEVCSEIILLAEKTMGKLSHKLHIVLTDHIGFAIERIKNNLEISNPFIYEIKNLYPEEYKIGLIAQKMIMQNVGIKINEDEIGFIALHLNAAKQNKEVKDALKSTIVIKKLVSTIENGLCKKIDNDLAYNRLINHFRGSIERAQKNICVNNPLIDTVKNELDKYYSIALKVGSIVREELGVDMSEGELGYLAIHIDRINRVLEEKHAADN